MQKDVKLIVGDVLFDTDNEQGIFTLSDVAVILISSPSSSVSYNSCFALSVDDIENKGESSA